MLTDAQYDRLPKVLKEIVDNDQERAALRTPAVISFEAVKGYARLQSVRRELRIGADKLWGHNLNKNSAHATREPDDQSLACEDGESEA